MDVVSKSSHAYVSGGMSCFSVAMTMRSEGSIGLLLFVGNATVPSQSTRLVFCCATALIIAPPDEDETAEEEAPAVAAAAPAEGPSSMRVAGRVRLRRNRMW
jgi:hypothetical protein